MSQTSLPFHQGETTNHNFTLTITGTTATPKARLIVPIDEGVNLSIQGKVTPGQNGEIFVEVDVPPLQKFSNDKSIIDNLHLEAIIDDEVKIPWKGSANVTQNVSVVAESVSSSNTISIPKKSDVMVKSSDVVSKVVSTNNHSFNGASDYI